MNQLNPFDLIGNVLLKSQIYCSTIKFLREFLLQKKFLKEF